MTENASGLEFDLEHTHVVGTDTAVRTVPLFETHTIHPIPQSERHGKARNLFTIWFAANLSPLAFITGALAPQAFGLGFVWSAVAIIAGTLLGGLLMAFHSAQGAQLGLPQMIQTRGQFGALGSLVILVVVVLMYLGFFASAGSLGASSLEVAVGGSTNGWMIPVMASSVLIAALGYRYIHVVGTIGTVICGVLMIGSALILLFGDAIDHSAFTSTAGFTWSGFLAMVAIGALWLIAFAPYVSDYSRYMPRTAAGVRSTFWSTYAGGVFGACMPMLIGVGVALAIEGDDILGGIPGVLGTGYGKLLLLAFVFITLHANAMNLYGGALTILTSIQTFRSQWRPVARARIAVATLMATAAAIIALGLSDDFEANYVNFILLLTITLVPWSIINLLDYYVVHKGDYDLDSLMAENGGIYGNWRWPALVSYAIGILVQIPFISSALYVGPIAEHVNGIDLSWVVGSLVTAPLYLVLVRMGSQPGARTR